MATALHKMASLDADPQQYKQLGDRPELTRLKNMIRKPLTRLCNYLNPHAPVELHNTMDTRQWFTRVCLMACLNSSSMLLMCQLKSKAAVISLGLMQRTRQQVTHSYLRSKEILPTSHLLYFTTCTFWDPLFLRKGVLRCLIRQNGVLLLNASSSSCLPAAVYLPLTHYGISSNVLIRHFTARTQIIAHGASATHVACSLGDTIGRYRKQQLSQHVGIDQVCATKVMRS